MSKPTGGGANTPVMRQYLTAKEKHPDALLFFRLGDFYELFFEDAVTAARALELTLTARNKGAEDEVPMAGVPYHAASSYIQRLLDQGFKVAICEQMADPSKVKGIVPREVVRVVTPGIVYDDAGLDARQNHYVVAVDRGEGGAFGLAALDLSTGELLACEASDPAIALAELVRLDPREVLLAPGAGDLKLPLSAARPRAFVRADGAPVDEDAVLGGLLGEAEARAACPAVLPRRAAARAVRYARACEPGRALPVPRLVRYELGETLLLDESTQAHLELVRTMMGDEKGSLLAYLDATRTAPGARLLRRRLLAPLTSVAEIRRRHDMVELLVTQPGLRTELRARLAEVRDIERLATKLAMDRASPRDLHALRASLRELPAIATAIARCPDAIARELVAAPGAPAAQAGLDTCADVAQLLERSLSDDPPLRASEGNAVRDGFDAALDEARTLTRDGQRVIASLESRLREQASIASLKLRYTRVFGWYIEVTRAHLEKVPKGWRRKQTIANGERYTCEELDDLADKLAHAEERAAAREAEIYAELSRTLATFAPRLRSVSASLAQLDVSAALAEVAHRDDHCRPEVDDSLQLAVEDGRHPVVERLAAAGRFVPNDVELDASPSADQAHRFWLITGPNMAGKSTLMRQVALLVVMAQMGAFVPARRARVGIVDRVLTRVGASDNLSRGESTFMVEMKETAAVLRRATRRSLVVLDEIGRGTSTYDGLAIAWAVAEHLHDVVGCRAMFATHYHELTELAATHLGCENHSVSAREHEGDIIFLHKLQRGAASRSYGVACAQLAGLPEPVLARARAILADLERGADRPRDAGGPLVRPARAAARTDAPQLDLFRARAEAAPHPALETLRAVDVNRLTPLEALQLVASLQAMARTP